MGPPTRSSSSLRRSATLLVLVLLAVGLLALPGCQALDALLARLPAPGEHVVYAVGDAAAEGYVDMSSRLAAQVPLPSEGLEAFLYLGDVYQTGFPDDFLRYDAAFGSAGRDLRSKTAAVLGNHESGNRAVGWIPYWTGSLVKPWAGTLTQTDPPYYAFTVGSWKFIALDTTHDVSAGSAQYAFLVDELKEPGFHAIVFGHHPRWSNGRHGNTDSLDDAWKAMCDYGAVAYLSGHDHNLQIQPRRDRNGAVVPTGGTIQLVAGAGGARLYDFSSGPAYAQPTWGDSEHYGVLRLRLRKAGFVAEFIGEDGSRLHAQTFALQGTSP